MKALVISQRPSDAGELVALAKGFGEPVILAFQESASKVDEVAAYGCRVYRVRSDRPEALYKAAFSLYESLNPKIIVGPSTKNVKDATALLAGSLDIPMVTEVVELSDGGSVLTYKRGFMSERVTMKAEVPYPVIALVNPKIVEPAEKAGRGEVIDLNVGELKVNIVGVRAKELSGVKLEEAEVVIGVGRGFKSKEDLKLAFELAKILNAQVGGTRPIAADLKWLPEDAWIGISGKKITPKLYIAVGVSGAPQHMSGVSGSKVIVAVNKDKSAPIFKQADYGVVADLYKFLPILTSKLREKFPGRA